MLNAKSLQHKNVKLKIIKAMQQSMNQNVAHVRNKNGDAFIAVRYLDFNDGIKRFEFTNSKGENVSSVIADSCLHSNYNKTLANLIFPNRRGNIVDKIVYSHMLRNVKK